MPGQAYDRINPDSPMKKNVGSYDAAVRFVGGCGLLMMLNHNFGMWTLVGVIPILSAALGFCPAYWCLHIDTATCDREPGEK